MVPYLGDFAEDATVYVYFNTFTSDDPSASITVTNLADTDIHVYKDGSETFIVTDGATVIINHDTTDLGDGVHLLTINTGIDAAYSIGSDYAVRVEGITVDAGTINAVVATFSIENRFNSSAADLALLKAAVITNAAGDDVAADIIALKAETVLILADTDDIGVAGAGLTNLGASGNDWNTVTPDAAGVAPTAAEIETEVWDGLQSAHLVADSMGIIASEIAALQTDLDTLTAGVTLAAGAITNVSLAGNMEIVFETDFATNYNQTDDAWVTNGTSFIGTGWNVNKTGYALTTANWNVGKTGYSLTTANWNVGKTGYQLSATGVDDIWDEDIVAAHNTADTAGAILNNILPEKNAAFSNIEFLWVAASDHVSPVTGASTTSVTRSIDGGAFGAGTGTLAEVANGIYQYDATAADMNGTIITFRFVATGGTPGAPDDAFVTIKTSG